MLLKQCFRWSLLPTCGIVIVTPDILGVTSVSISNCSHEKGNNGNLKKKTCFHFLGISHLELLSRSHNTVIVCNISILRYAQHRLNNKCTNYTARREERKGEHHFLSIPGCVGTIVEHGFLTLRNGKNIRSCMIVYERGGNSDGKEKGAFYYL